MRVHVPDTNIGEILVIDQRENKRVMIHTRKRQSDSEIPRSVKKFLISVEEVFSFISMYNSLGTRGSSRSLLVLILLEISCLNLEWHAHDEEFQNYTHTIQLGRSFETSRQEIRT